MKTGIHPAYHTKVKVTCSCGNTFETGSTEENIDVEVCSACHPFYTGKQKLVDSGGRLKRFEERRKQAQKGMKTKKKAGKKDDPTSPGLRGAGDTVKLG